MTSIILLKNKRLLRPRTTEYGSNCRTRENCLLQNQCLTPNLIYRADLENNSNKGTKIYFVLAEAFFKTTRKVSIMNNTEQNRVVKIYVIVKRGANNIKNQMINC